VLEQSPVKEKPLSRPKRAKATPARDEDVAAVARTSRRTRQKPVDVAEEVEEVKDAAEEPRTPKVVLKSGSVAKGPDGELVFYSPNVSRNSRVDCEVYQSEERRIYGKSFFLFAFFIVTNLFDRPQVVGSVRF